MKKKYIYITCAIRGGELLYKDMKPFLQEKS